MVSCGVYFTNQLYVEQFVNVLFIYDLLPLTRRQHYSLQKTEITMEVGGLVQVSLGFVFVENRPKIALNQC